MLATQHSDGHVLNVPLLDWLVPAACAVHGMFLGMAQQQPGNNPFALALVHVLVPVRWLAPCIGDWSVTTGVLIRYLKHGLCAC